MELGKKGGKHCDPWVEDLLICDGICETTELDRRAARTFFAITEWRRLHLQDIQEGKISAQDKMAWNNDFGLKSLEMIPRIREYFEQRRPEAAKFLAKYDPTDDILLNLGRGMLT